MISKTDSSVLCFVLIYELNGYSRGWKRKPFYFLAQLLEKGPILVKISADIVEEMLILYM